VTASDALAALMAPGPVPGSVKPCGCHIRRPEGTDPYLTVLCDEHEAEMGDVLRAMGTQTATMHACGHVAVYPGCGGCDEGAEWRFDAEGLLTPGVDLRRRFARPVR